MIGDETMVSQKMLVVNEVGLHMRPAGVFANEMSKFECDVNILYKDAKINAKSLLNIMSACIKCGAQIIVECDGIDENEALSKADELISSGFAGL